MINAKTNLVGLVKATLEDEFVNINTLQSQVNALDTSAIETTLDSITATLDQYGLVNIINLTQDVSTAKSDILTLQQNITSLAASLGSNLANYYGDMGTFANTLTANIDLGTF
jgi:hypothetical protein